MNSVACCSRAFPEARNHSSLDQARPATIVCTPQTTMDSLYETIIKGKWNRVFGGHRSHLRIKNFGNIQEREWHDPRDTTRTGKIRRRRAVLTGVKSLEVSSDKAANQQMVSYSTVYDLFSILPGVLDINLKLGAFNTKQCFSFCSTFNRCPKYKRMKWNAPICLHLHGGLGSSNLSEVSLNRCVFVAESRARLAEYAVPEDDVYMMKNCTRLRRLSIKDVRLKVGMCSGQQYYMCQTIIIKMVRNHPTLRWLRSDLTAENVAMLQRERPDITFVSE
jgi:hypothetical protein